MINNDQSFSMQAASSMDPDLQRSLSEFFRSDPAYAAEYNRHMAWATPGTDNRSQEEWMYDALKNDPGLLQSFQTYTTQPAEVTANEDVPVEQDLLDRALNDYIYPDLDKDKQRQLDAQSVLDRYNAGIDDAIRLNQGNIDGSRLAAEIAASEGWGQRLKDSVGAEYDSRIGALDQLQANRLAAYDPVAAARVAAAENQVAAINQGLGRSKDEIAAADAMNGFVGGSSMKDAELARAVIGARQNAAATRSGADLTNASDKRSILDAVSDGKASAMYDKAAGVKDVEGKTVDWNKSYFDNDWTRRLASALVPSSLEANRLQLMGAADDYGFSGLNRAQKTLNWWNTSAAPITLQTPDLLTYQQTASNAGNDLSALGAGLFKSGLPSLTKALGSFGGGGGGGGSNVGDSGLSWGD